MRVKTTIRSFAEVLATPLGRSRFAEVREDLDVILRQLGDDAARHVAAIRTDDDRAGATWHSVVKSSSGEFWTRLQVDVGRFLEPALVRGGAFGTAAIPGLASYRTSEIRFVNPAEEQSHRDRVAAARRKAADLALWNGQVLLKVLEPVWLVKRQPLRLRPSFERPAPRSGGRAFRLTGRGAAVDYLEWLERVTGRSASVEGRVNIIDAGALEFDDLRGREDYAAETLSDFCDEFLKALDRLAAEESRNDTVLSEKASRLKDALATATRRELGGEGGG
jgi:hypothetical protein